MEQYKGKLLSKKLTDLLSRKHLAEELATMASWDAKLGFSIPAITDRQVAIETADFDKYAKRFSSPKNWAIAKELIVSNAKLLADQLRRKHFRRLTDMQLEIMVFDSQQLHLKLRADFNRRPAELFVITAWQSSQPRLYSQTKTGLKVALGNFVRSYRGEISLVAYDANDLLRHQDDRAK